MPLPGEKLRNRSTDNTTLGGGHRGVRKINWSGQSKNPGVGKAGPETIGPVETRPQTGGGARAVPEPTPEAKTIWGQVVAQKLETMAAPPKSCAFENVLTMGGGYPPLGVKEERNH